MNDPASPPCAQVCSACRLESLSSAVSTHSTVVVSSCPVCWEMCRPFPARRISHDFITHVEPETSRSDTRAGRGSAGRQKTDPAAAAHEELSDASKLAIRARRGGESDFDFEQNMFPS
ncbi:hypothetical protein OH76DRAFT_1245287 [Lentinus brumalis]|uniref:Uncharacterized protein n=1 Tax=Lentinus brumalis TaxID=2498619 RepID=A0A371CS35_9APHY|nr:hypothetical protein OH76DRAFT_1245287 [Polyporus brumalis]